MKKMLLLCLFISYLLSGITIGQIPYEPYEPLSFESLSPIWYETIYDEDLDGFYSDGYNYFSDYLVQHIDPIVDGDYVYSTLSFRGWDDKNLGAYFEKRDAQTGELIWTSKYDTTGTGRQEVPRVIYLNDEGDLVVIGLKRVAAYNMEDPILMIQGGSNNMRYTERVYDADNGSLIYHFDPDITDSSLAILSANRSWDRRFFDERDSTILRYVSTTTVLDTSSDTSDYIVRIIAYDIDKQGKVNSSVDSLIMFLDNNSLTIVPNGASGYLLIKDEDGVVEFNYLDRQLKIEKQIITEASNYVYGNYYLDRIQPNRILLKNALTINFSNFTPRYAFALYNEEGILLNNPSFEPNTKYGDYYTPLVFDTSDDVFLLACQCVPEVDTEPNFSPSLDILQSNDENGFDIVNRFNFEGFNVAIPTNAKLLNDGNILLLSKEMKWNLIFDYPSYIERSFARSMMVLNPEDLGLVLPSSTKDYSFNYDNTVKIAPNLVSNYLNCNFEQSFTGQIHIYDLQGKLYKTTNIHKSNFAGLQVSHLSSGIYMVIFTDFDGIPLMQKEKFIKI